MLQEKEHQTSVEDSRPSKRKNVEEALAEGGVTLTEERVRVYCVICYLHWYNEPDESDWGAYAQEIHREVGCSVNTLKRVFECIRDGDVEAALKRKKAAVQRESFLQITQA